MKDKSVTYLVHSSGVQPTGAVGEALLAATQVPPKRTTPSSVKAMIVAAHELKLHGTLNDPTDDDIILYAAEWAESKDRHLGDLNDLHPLDRERIIREYDNTTTE